MIAYCLQKTCVLSIPDVFGRFPQLIENNLVGYDSKGMIDERNVKRIKRPSMFKVKLIQAEIQESKPCAQFPLSGLSKIRHF